MLTIRCTQRLLKRLGLKPDPSPPPSTTRLGDWYAYANLLYTPRGQFILCTSERSLLPVIVPAKDARLLLPAKLSLALGVLLTNLGVPFELIRPELIEMEPVSYAKTASRVVLGMMNDFTFATQHYMQHRSDVMDANLRLAQTPCSPIRMGYPIDVARSLLTTAAG